MSMATSPKVDLSVAVWVKSSHSEGNSGNCVEWAPGSVGGGVVPVRDSKDPEGPALVFGVEAWASFVGFAAGFEV
ncbi:DUF397 domain-containing protein [Kitasatospora sp. NPDC096147]|uniref:DUF397 domain-containing protein n=1 Tax=Kitasatospora sp. NPDC096147 TaxID=3364093 RepID=UPI0037F7A131